MPKKAFFIGPYDKGLINAVKPWLVPEESFAELNNAYVWRGRVKKRVGSKLFESTIFTGNQQSLGSRLRMALSGGAGVGSTDGTGAATQNLSVAGYGTVFKVGQMFSIGSTVYTVYQTGTPANMLKTDGTTTATFNTTNGTYTFAGAPAGKQIYWYPAEPVMGLITYEQTSINNEPVYAFDTQFVYYRTGNAWERLLTAAGADPVWTGSDSQFFWPCNYRGAANHNYVLFVTNYNQADGIWYWSGTRWTVMRPQTSSLGATYVLHSARMLFNFKNRLVALNTIEQVGGATSYTFANRARWSQNGTPIPTVPDPDPWYENTPGKGSFSDAATKQAIVSARILKDRLIVYFERSTWELVYTGNHVQPFVWQVLDDQLGAESTFSSVLFDKVVFGVGETGVHACDGLRVQRIDDAIPQLAFQIHNENNGIERVAGIRDYATEMVYWSYPGELYDTTYPDKLLAYNYKNESWSVWDDSITVFGYWQNNADLTWGAASTTWGTTSRTWGAGSMQGLFRNVLAGNQEGFTFIMDPGVAENAPALQVTNIDATGWPVLIVDVVDHNLHIGTFVKIQHTVGLTNLDGRILKVAHIVSSSRIHLCPYSSDDAPVGTYTGRAVLSQISLIDIKTKEYNFYQEDSEFAINKVEFNVDRTKNGKLNVGFYSSTNTKELGDSAIGTGTAVGTYMLDTMPYAIEPFENEQARLNRRVYIQAQGDCIQLRLYFDEELSFDENVQASPFEMNSMTFYATPTAHR